MKIHILENTLPGQLLCDAEYGSVVRLAKGGDAFYLVTNPMDGSARKVLVSLVSGNAHPAHGPATYVLEVNATLTIEALK